MKDTKKKKNAARDLPHAEPEWEYNKQKNMEDDAVESNPSNAVEQQLKELASAVKQMDQPLTPDVQRALANAQKMVVVDPTIQLQSATAKFRNARDQLLQARRARQSMHSSWAKFIAEAVQRWNKHTEDFEARDAEHVSAIQDALEKYQSAKDIMEQSKEAVNASDINIAEQTDPTDEELMVDATPSIQDDLRAMVQNFDKIRARQDENLEGVAAKKARIDSGSEAVGDKPSFGARSLQPFGGGGK